jgi:hypothetical protein
MGLRESRLVFVRRKTEIRVREGPRHRDSPSHELGPESSPISVVSFSTFFHGLKSSFSRSCGWRKRARVLTSLT